MSRRDSIEPQKGQNIQVVVRCRPLNNAERREGTKAIVQCKSDVGEVVVNVNGRGQLQQKGFRFDRVFGQYATQEELFDTSVVPIIEEALQGFNCTVFAYGQTGTGKTYTMEGDIKESAHSGIIPRSIYRIFKELQKNPDGEYSVRVSYLEVYNEQLDDLLSKAESPRLRIVEDSKKGVLCHNLEEILVHNPKEIFDILEGAVQKRRTAETLMNKNSSRSHCIFSLTIHMKETTEEGEDLLKVGKLNLVDLAGSECVGRSGAKNDRAREAKNINQSLLTLGRVITALVERWGHIPYRDSKLTRLLQDSLGGRTKTCIIATLSPSILSLDESLSTLDYAHRAKNIKNRPEVNQRMTKRALIKEYSLEIEKLKQALSTQRSKEGVYIAQGEYDQMKHNSTTQSSQLSELEAALATKEKAIHNLRTLFDENVDALQKERERSREAEDLSVSLKNAVKHAVYKLDSAEESLLDEKAVVAAHRETENVLLGIASEVKQTAENVVNDVEGLHAKIERKYQIEAENRELAGQLHQEGTGIINIIMEKSHEFASSQQKALLNLRSSVERFTQAKNDELVLVDSQLCALRSCVEKLANDVSNSTNQFGEVLSHVHEESQGFVSNIKSSHENARQAQHQAICSAAAAFERLVEEQRQVVGNWRSQTAAEATKICNTVDDFRTQQEAIFNQIHSVVLNYEKKQCASLQKSQNELSTLLLSQHKARKMHIERIGQELQLLSNEHQNDIECILRSREASNKEHVQVLDSQSKEISLLENTLKDASTSGLQQLREYALGVNRSVDSREAANLREQEGFLAAFRAHQEYLDDLSNRSSSQLERVIQSSESSRKESDHQLSVLVGQLTSSTSSDNQEFASSTRTLQFVGNCVFISNVSVPNCPAVVLLLLKLSAELEIKFPLCQNPAKVFIVV
eukprot:TRINITY_DN549_c2_g1_i5.p1 TRINITY_DN549_c2_g1~~TRINITY_DN549_c2_g1_i5.p1  ORF type:complete len:917 (-),score=156.06 TRINITY_DN549_c2_g1_i5:1936-4686(-)